MKVRNLFRRRVENGQIVLGAKASSFRPSVIEVYGDIGLDFVWLDFEHGGMSPWNSFAVENLTRAAEVADIELLVRLPDCDPALIRKMLDAGVCNILLPRVDTAAEVRTALEATRFEYDGEPGERGTASGRAAAYGGAKDEYVSAEDDSVMAGIMLEKRTAYDNLDEILRVPSLGFVFVGPGDLSIQLGHPERRTHETVQKTITDIERRVTDSDVALGGIGNRPDEANEMIETGYQILRVGSEFGALRSTFSDRVRDVERSP